MDINSNVFEQSIYENCILYVPTGTISKYRECTGWKEFLNIKEGSPTGISPVKMEKDADIMYYTIDGRRISKPQKGLYIINGKKVIGQ